MTSMGMLITAIALAASLVQAHAAPPTRELAATRQVPQTLYTVPSGTIQAFAQDRQLLAWFSPSTKACNAVWVLSLDNGATVRLPNEIVEHEVRRLEAPAMLRGADEIVLPSRARIGWMVGKRNELQRRHSDGVHLRG